MKSMDVASIESKEYFIGEEEEKEMMETSKCMSPPNTDDVATPTLNIKSINEEIKSSGYN
jgi:hypothetical protein